MTLHTLRRFSFPCQCATPCRCLLKNINSNTSYQRFIPLFSQGGHLSKVRESCHLYSLVLQILFVDPAILRFLKANLNFLISKLEMQSFHPSFPPSLVGYYFCYQTGNTPTLRPVAVPDGHRLQEISLEQNKQRQHPNYRTFGALNKIK